MIYSYVHTYICKFIDSRITFNAYLSVRILYGWYIALTKSSFDETQHQRTFSHTASAEHNDPIVVALFGHCAGNLILLFRNFEAFIINNYVRKISGWMKTPFAKGFSIVNWCWVFFIFFWSVLLGALRVVFCTLPFTSINLWFCWAFKRIR